MFNFLGLSWKKKQVLYLKLLLIFFCASDPQGQFHNFNL